MTRRPLTLLIALAAAIVYFGFALPARRAAADLGDEYRRARERRREATLRLSRAERDDFSRMARKQPVFASLPATDALVALRRSVLESMKAWRVSNVHLSVDPGRGPGVATVHLTAQGRFEDVVGLSAAVARAGSGIVLGHVRFSPGGDTILLGLDATSLGGRP